MNRLAILLFWIGALASLAAAASAPTFCKCTCFSNSTIIEIKSKSSSSGSSSSHLKEEGPSSNDDEKTSSSSVSTPSATPDLPDNDEDAPTTGDNDNIPSGDETQPDNITPFSDLPQSPEHLFHTKTRRSGRRTQVTSPSCSQCNRAFCLSQSLPICKGASEKDVVTMCFQRDSRKDQIVVWGFILGTAGLLGWAALRKVMEMQETGAFIGAGGALLSRATGGRIGGGGGGSGPGGGRGGAAGGRGGLGGFGIGRSGGSSSDWRGQYASVATHSRQNSVAPLMGEGLEEEH